MFIPYAEDVDILIGKTVTLHEENINNVFSYEDSLYFTTGYAHFKKNYGFLYSIDLQDNIVKTTKRVDLEDESHAVGTYKDLIVVATTNRFYAIRNWKKELILDNAFWSGFNPISIAMLDYNTAYIGMYGFYAKVDLKTKKMELYRYNK